MVRRGGTYREWGASWVYLPWVGCIVGVSTVSGVGHEARWEYLPSVGWVVVVPTVSGVGRGGTYHLWGALWGYLPSVGPIVRVSTISGVRRGGTYRQWGVVRVPTVSGVCCEGTYRQWGASWGYLSSLGCVVGVPTVSGVRCGGGECGVNDAGHDAGATEVLDSAPLWRRSRCLDEERSTHGLASRGRRITAASVADCNRPGLEIYIFTFTLILISVFLTRIPV